MIKALDRIQHRTGIRSAPQRDAARAEIMFERPTPEQRAHHSVTKVVLERHRRSGRWRRAPFRRWRGVPAFPDIWLGARPGHHDTVPRTLDAGAYVIRKAAVQKYGSGALSRLANRAMGGVAHFAKGGSNTVTQPNATGSQVEAEK